MVVGFNYKMILLILEWKGVSKVVLLLVYTIFYKLANHESHPDVTIVESWIKEIGNRNCCVSHKMDPQHIIKLGNLCATTE